MSAIALGFAAARARLLRRPTALAALLGLALALTGALIERNVGGSGAVDRALAGTFRLIIPLVAFGLVAEIAARGRLHDAVWPVARWGTSRASVALGHAVAALVSAAVLSALFAVATVIAAHAPGAGEPPLVVDVAMSAWIGALTGAAYASWFLLGSTFFGRGGGRWIPLVADFTIGDTTGLAGALLPRAHAQNLLGGAAPLHLAQAASSAALAAFAVGLALVAAYRCRE